MGTGVREAIDRLDEPGAKNILLMLICGRAVAEAGTNSGTNLSASEDDSKQEAVPGDA
jgi:hypothetical protein